MKKTLGVWLWALLVSPDTRAETTQELARQARQILARQCLACHGPDAKGRKAGLRLDERAAFVAVRNGEAAVVPGKPKDSLLWQRIVTGDPDERMPPADHGPAVPEAERETLRRWILEGAPWVAHWAFEPPRLLPQAGDLSAQIDGLVSARLAKSGLRLSPEAPRETLLRRASLDLVGLPPTPAEVRAFLRDTRPDAYERVVDRLLASPAFGERWARTWLDVARYADSNGYSIDSPRQIWPYRDWVVTAFNRDLPFGDFVIHQFAGDLLPDATEAHRVATGFARNTMTNEEGGIDKEQFRVEAVADRVSTMGAAFLGLTLGCARCHDHKYDPISQREFFSFYAFWNDQDEVSLPLGDSREAARAAAIEPQIRALQAELYAEESAWQRALNDPERARLSREITVILGLSPEQRDPGQWRRLFEFLRPLGPRFAERIATLEALFKRRPRVVSTLVLAERAKPRATVVHLGGDFTRKGAAVDPAVPAVLPPLVASPGRRPNRLDLARWLVDARHPLTHRVMVNRYWQALFGVGLVETENDFGIQGAPPTHPELLDHLAASFAGPLGGSTKRLLRALVLSKTYRQSSAPNTEGEAKDPLNTLLWRQRRLRLEAELIRDAALRASGKLSLKMGGPPVHPPQPDGVFGFTQIPRNWVASTGPDRYRRGLYTFLWRSAPHPAFQTFDAPDASATCTRRNRSTTPLQALTLLNDPAYWELAQALGTSLMKLPGSDRQRIQEGFLRVVGRAATPDETQRLAALLAAERAGFAGEREVNGGPRAAAYVQLGRVLLNLDEFITRE